MKFCCNAMYNAILQGGTFEEVYITIGGERRIGLNGKAIYFCPWCSKPIDIEIEDDFMGRFDNQEGME